MLQQLLGDCGMLTDFSRLTAPWANLAVVSHNDIIFIFLSLTLAFGHLKLDRFDVGITAGLGLMSSRLSGSFL